MKADHKSNRTIKQNSTQMTSGLKIQLPV